MEIWQRFTSTARRAILLAHSEAARSRAQLIGTEHLLLGLLRLAEGAALESLTRAGVDVEGLAADLQSQLAPGLHSEPSPEVSFTPDAQQVLSLAYNEARQMNDAHVGTEHILLGLLRLGKGPAYQLLRHHGADLRTIRRMVEDINTGSGTTTPPAGSRSQSPTLDHYSRDLTVLAHEGALDPVIGRQQEVDRVIQILCRRTKNNPCLIGEAGVGKTAIAESLAQKIADGTVPQPLQGRRLVALDLASLVAGTKYRGEFEERMKRVMEEIREAQGSVIVFLDELHTVVGTGAAEGAMDASNILKPALARGEMQVIGATTLDEYRKYIEKNPSLERRFQPVMVREPNREETLAILNGIQYRYEDFHGVAYSREAVEAAVDLSTRYIADRMLPDKAIDLIDESGSRVKLRRLREPLDAPHEPEPAYLSATMDRLEAELSAHDFGEETAKTAPPEVLREDIAEIVAMWTGVPVMELTEQESKRLLRMEAALHDDIIGQEEAIASVSRSVRRSRAGLKDQRRPIGSFMFLGPTGVGKTLLARVLARFLFGDEDALVRVDMSEYMEKFSVSRLIGAPPGYVGYDESGQLTEAVRRRPYSVVLFDEIEKAHPEVFNILLQIMEDGSLTDAQGRKVDFKNTVIIMTSNVGARTISEGRNIGFGHEPEAASAEKLTREYDRMKTRVTDELRKTFSPEFLNRLDEVVVFRALSAEEIREIVDLELRPVSTELASRGLILTVGDALRDQLAETGYDPGMGARPLRRAVRRLIEDPLAERLLMWDSVSGEIVADWDPEAKETTFELVETALPCAT
ncbi:MAG TPA: ATP-dependent Clp protease ATP-binding subunit [Armatimonadota bacterium]|jgi:ATP-dependent Clp protease ATP-binding subunit ClpC